MGRALHTFDGCAYGPEYLSFDAGETLWCSVESSEQEWVKGMIFVGTSALLGWFPPTYWSATDGQSPDAGVSPEEFSRETELEDTCSAFVPPPDLTCLVDCLMATGVNCIFNFLHLF